MSTPDKSIGQLCIQVHPDLAPELNLARLKEECEVIARRTDGVRGIDFTEGNDGGPYLNIIFATERPRLSWRNLKATLLESSEFGNDLSASCMCVCTGENGWEDYLMLYHFDPATPLVE
jgi:hypothetical protein